MGESESIYDQPEHGWTGCKCVNLRKRKQLTWYFYVFIVFWSMRELVRMFFLSHGLSLNEYFSRLLLEDWSCLYDSHLVQGPKEIFYFIRTPACTSNTQKDSGRALSPSKLASIRRRKKAAIYVCGGCLDDFTSQDRVLSNYFLIYILITLFNLQSSTHQSTPLRHKRLQV